MVLLKLVSAYYFNAFKNCETLIHAFVTSKLDYCNALLSGLSQNQIQRLQYVQNSAARLLTGTRKYNSITPILRELHWIPVAERIHFKILLLTFKSLNGMAPFYLRELLSPYILSRTLRSSSKSSLVIPRCNLKTYGQRAFSYTAPVLWNSLPEDMRSCKSLTTFKTKLKTFLLKRIFKLTLHHTIIIIIIIIIIILFNCKYCQFYYLILNIVKRCWIPCRNSAM